MIFKELTADDFRTEGTTSNQLVDILQDDAATPEKRKRYQAWYSASRVLSGDLPTSSGVAEITGDLRQVISGLFQTVHDIDHTQQTANPLMDMTVGIRPSFEVDESSGDVTWDVPLLDTYFEEFDSQGKAIWKERSLMVNEKLDLYRQMAQQLMGSRATPFYRNPEAGEDPIDYAMFLPFKRLFFRDGMKRGTYAMRWGRDLVRLLSPSAASGGPDRFSIQSEFPYWTSGYMSTVQSQDIYERELIITDTQSAGSDTTTIGGSYGILRVVSDDGGPLSAPFDDDPTVGLIFYDAGVVVLDLERVCDMTQRLGGIISTLVDNDLGADYDISGTWTTATIGWFHASEVDADEMVDVNQTFLPINKRVFGGDVVDATGYSGLDDGDMNLRHLLIEGTIDDAVDHLANTRMLLEPDSALSAITFQNRTKIKSMLVFCHIGAGEFNYSNNPTYTTEGGRIIPRDDDGVKPFSYITKVGLYDAANNLIAVASMSRPIENGPDRNMTIRLRLDF